MDNSTLQAALAEYFAPWVQALGLVAQERAGVERGAELGEGPALDQPHLGLHDVAARDLVEELHRRQRLEDLVAAGLDVAHLAERAREQLELVAPQRDARLFELLHRGAEIFRLLGRCRKARATEGEEHQSDLQGFHDVPPASAGK